MSTCFFGGQTEIARFDKQVHPIFEKLTIQQLGYRWRETEVDLSKDRTDFPLLSAAEQHIFTSNIKRQILLDTVQGRAPALALLPIASLPEVENWLIEWTQSETIHSRTYTHIIRNTYPNPSEILDSVLSIKEIVDCKRDISKYYDDLIAYTRLYQTFGEGYIEGMHCEGCNSPNDFEHEISLYELKKKLWLCLMAICALEGVRFYASFACSWAFAEQKSAMEGNAKEIKLICRDENLHLAGVQHMLKILPKEDPDFAKIAEEAREEATRIFVETVDQEVTWAEYLFQYGSMIGLNKDMLVTFVKERAAKVMKQCKLPAVYESGNSLPWTQKWISGADVQVAPQETELTSYTSGNVKQDVDANTFAGFSL